MDYISKIIFFNKRCCKSRTLSVVISDDNYNCKVCDNLKNFEFYKYK